MALVSEGLKSSPAADTILADTGAFDPGTGVDLTVLLSASVQVSVMLEHRNTANDANLKSHLFVFAASTPHVLHVANNYIVATDERIRLRLIQQTVGDVQGSLNIG